MNKATVSEIKTITEMIQRRIVSLA